MSSSNALLILNEPGGSFGKYELTFVSHELFRHVDTNGRPTTDYFGGTITMTFKNPAHAGVLQWMTSKHQAKNGLVKYVDAMEGITFYDVEFERAYVVQSRNTFSSGSKSGALQLSITISAEKIIIHGNTIDNKWEQ